MADQRSPASRHTGTGRFAPHQLQEADMETAQRSLTDQFQQVQRRAQQLMESMNIPGASAVRPWRPRFFSCSVAGCQWQRHWRACSLAVSLDKYRPTLRCTFSAASHLAPVATGRAENADSTTLPKPKTHPCGFSQNSC